MPKVIKEFTGNNFFLSNFFCRDMTYLGQTWISAESAYQAMKSTRPSDQAMVRNATTPRQAKKLGRSVELRKDWEVAKIGVMEDILRAKFQNTQLRELLIETGDAFLIEGNNWGDGFWGMCEGTGHNMLGVLLMKERTQCRLEEIHMPATQRA